MNLPLVLPDKMEVIPANSDSAGHFCAVHGSGEDTASDRDISGEWALLVNVGTYKKGKKQSLQLSNTN